MTDDERVALALAALAEVTDPANVGELVEAAAPAPGVVDLRFATTQPGYPGWTWTVSTSAVDGVEPTVLEVELLPGDGSLLAPSWVPWAERLAEWRRSHPEGEEPPVEDADDDLDEDDADEDDLDDVLDPDDDLDGVDDPDGGADPGDPADDEDDEDDESDDEDDPHDHEDDPPRA